jgi:glycolate oxidase iron-sulfur subunit
VTPGPLALDADALASCVSCGLCLPHCPTYRVSGEEVASPRGRIAAMRLVEGRGAPIDAAFVTAMDACVQCRGCDAACPSGVPFGRLMEQTRAALADRHDLTPRRQRLAMRALGSPRLLRVGSLLLAAGQRVRLVPRRLGLPRLPFRRPALRATGNDAWLFTGCVMDAWQREVHVAAADVLTAMGVGFALPGRGGACCGALHVHAGLAHDAQRLARRVVQSMPGDAPILVDSAGCGAALKDYGHLLDDHDAARFAARVRDIHEFLADHAERLPPPVRRIEVPVAVQDPCHLRHVQKAHLAVRDVLRPYADLVELDDEGLCCGAGGAYAPLHPETSAQIRERKVAAVARSRAVIVASANPGCSMHLAAAGLDVRHPLQLVAEALRH